MSEAKVFAKNEDAIERYTKEEADFILSDPGWWPDSTVKNVRRERDVVMMTQESGKGESDEGQK